MSTRLMRWVRVAVTLGLLALLASRLDMAAAVQRIAQGAPGWMLAAVLLLVLQTGLSALRWQVTARVFGIEIGTGRAVREYFLAQIVNLSLPGGVLGDVGRAIRAGHHAGMARAGLSVAMERLWGQIALFAVLLAGVVWARFAPGGPLLPEALTASLILGTAGVAVAALALPAAAFLPGLAGRPAAVAARVLRQGLLSPGARTPQALLSLGTVATNLLAFALCARATGTALTLAEVLVLVPVILFAMVLPLTLGGWGLREGTAAALFPLAGATPEAGLAASVIFGLTFLVSSLPGLLVLLLDWSGYPAVAGAGGASPAAPVPRPSGHVETRRHDD